MRSGLANRDSTFRYFIVIVGIVTVTLFAIVDPLLAHHPSLVMFYLAPVCLVTWFSGPRMGALIALCSIVAWSFNNLNVAKELYYNEMFFYINMIVRGCFLFAAVYAVEKFKRLLRRERELSDELNIKNKQLKEMNERKSAFVANVSHEFKNPLAVIGMSVEMLMKCGITAKQEKLIKITKNSSDRLSRLVRDLLDLSKIESGKVVLNREKIEIGTLVNEVINSCQGLVGENKTIISKSLQQNVGLVLADRDKMTQVLINLLSNAIKYAPGGKVNILIKDEEKDVRFEISDTGQGIPKEYQEKIFDKFERVTMGGEEGTGLGLPIAKDIITLHKGKIWVESEPGKGSKFIFTLPR